MKRKMLKVITLLLIALLSATGIALADGFSIPVSVIMPAIPGVNVPLIEEQTVKTQEGQTVKTEIDYNAQQQIAAQNKATKQSQSLIQQDIPLMANQEGPLFLVKTFYSR